MLWYFRSHEKCTVVTQYTRFQFSVGITYSTFLLTTTEVSSEKKDEKKGGPPLKHHGQNGRNENCFWKSFPGGMEQASSTVVKSSAFFQQGESLLYM